MLYSELNKTWEQLFETTKSSDSSAPISIKPIKK